jgi:ABC-type sugar transport system ATPase subunit
MSTIEDKIILRMKNITKRFPGVLALNNVDLELKRGEVLAVAGENGAGKSTLLKILSGAYTQYDGEIELEGKKVTNYSINTAKKLGVSIINQELENFADLSVAENIYVNRLPEKGPGVIDWKTVHENAKKVINQIGIEIDTHKTMQNLTVAEQQMVEIAKGISENMKVLIMDEPTSALNKKESESLLKLVREMASNGVSIIIISHKLDDLFAVSNRFQVLRNGESVLVKNTKDTDKGEIIFNMIGRDIKEMYPKEDIELGGTLLKVENLSAGKIKNISIELKKGEILGIFGLIGSGSTDLARSLFGDLKLKSGKIWLDGKLMKLNSPEQALKFGIGYVPSERKEEGLMLKASVVANTVITSLNKLAKGLLYNGKEEALIAEKWKNALSIKTPRITTIIETLSGGNQQKVVIAKWLEANVRILILNEPTRGIDVGAKVEIYKLIEKLSRQGIGIIMISSEMPEILGLSDRIVVITEGVHTATLSRQEANQEALLKYAIGGI